MNLQTLNELEQAAKNVLMGKSDAMGRDYMPDVLAVCVLAREWLETRKPACGHKRQKWALDMRSGHCEDCGAKLTNTPSPPSVSVQPL